jgi:methionyl-tRNA synthetase
MPTKEFADETSAKFLSMTKALGCSNDDFIRTTEPRHKAAVKEMWRRLVDRGLIYLGDYEGWYSVRDEAFYSENELVDGKAPTGAPVEWVTEESYFFKLSAFTEPLLKLYKENPEFIGPEGRRNEVLSFVGQEGGLHDLSISRTTFNWGITVPDDPKHVVYVWLDALVNYISAIGWSDQTQKDNSIDSKMSTHWSNSLHIVGKDILRFHAVYWPAFLMAAGLPPPRRVYAHGWWTKDGEKMSKSVGNVLDPFVLLEDYGADYLRYFLMAEVPFGNDGDFSSDAMTTRINSQLSNELGNLVQRTVSMIVKNCDGKIPMIDENGLTPEDEDLLLAAENALIIAQGHVDKQALHRMVDSIINVARLGNKYIDVQAPWVLVKKDPARMGTVLYVLSETIRRIAVMLEPVIPTSCEKILKLIGAEAEMCTFDSIKQRIASGTPVMKPTPIFPRIESSR